ncbi:MAG: HIT domain-containing protein [Vicinamibacterales bacterium]
MDRLWSPWRLQYVSGNTKDRTGCVFCAPAGSAGSDSLVVHDGLVSYVVLNLYPYNNGHLMVVPRRHVATLHELTPDELQEIAIFTQRSEAVLTSAYRPDGINVGINLGKSAGAGIHEHLHVHLVPRWDGDTNFMTVVGDTRVLPEDLAATVSRLKPLFDAASGS